MIAIGKIPVKQPDRITFAKTGAPRYVTEFEGPVGFMDGITSQMRVNFEEVSIDTADGVSTVRGYSRAPIGAESEAPVTNIELSTEQESLSLEFSPTFSPLSDTTLVAIDNQLRDNKKGKSAKYEAIQTAATEAGDNVALAQYLFSLRLRGVDSFLEWSITCNRTITASRYYSATFNFNGHGKLWSDGDLSAELGSIPVFNLPELTSTAAQQNLRLYRYWLKTQTAVNFSSTGQFQVVEQWRRALWNIDLYSTFSP